MHTISLRLAVAALATCSVASAAPAAFAATPAGVEQVVCHYTYGGENRTHTALPLSSGASPYAVKAIDIGSFFHFRIVFEDRPAASAAIKIYTYADRDDGPLLIHQATFAYPPAMRAGARFGRYGFSGLHFVYEPMRDGELQYWCELAPAKRVDRGSAR